MERLQSSALPSSFVSSSSATLRIERVLDLCDKMVQVWEAFAEVPSLMTCPHIRQHTSAYVSIRQQQVWEAFAEVTSLMTCPHSARRIDGREVDVCVMHVRITCLSEPVCFA